MVSTVLILDDDIDIRAILASALFRAGFSVIEADSALQPMLRLNDIPLLDIVVADFNLPDGRDLVPNLMKLRPSLPVIVLSSDPSALSLPCQADAVLGKPISVKVLVGELRRLLKAA